ncbi:hypothetical protein H1C71_006538, partial [Ictidomys tridecemlineatus]
ECVCVCVRCYAGQEGGDRGGGGGSVYCPSRCVDVRKPGLKRGGRRRPLRRQQRPRRGLGRPEQPVFQECEDKAPPHPRHVRTPLAPRPHSRSLHLPEGFGPAA